MPHGTGRVVRRALWCAACISMASSLSRAQVIPAALNPVYPDDAPVARETLQRVAEFVASNPGQAVHELQRLLEDQGERVVWVTGSAGVYMGVRAQVHARLLSEGKLLELYRSSEEPVAAKMLERGEIAEVERTRLLTPSGFEAALRLAQMDVEDAHFEAARLVLEQLESHPDRGASAEASRRRDAAAILTLVARYIDRPEVWERAERWSLEAGAPMGERPKPFPRPAIVSAPVQGVGNVVGVPPKDAVPAHPLWNERLEPTPLPDEPGGMHEPDAPPEQVAENGWVFPSVVGDTLYVNDGSFVTARDRYTLRPKWSVLPVSDGNGDDPYLPRRSAATRSTGRQVQDFSSVSVQGRTLVATMGLAQGNAREGSSLTLAIDVPSGRVLWSVDVARLDPALDGASVRGAALIDPIEGGTVVLLARKPSQGRRTITLYMVGLRLETGDLRWVRPIASAGSILYSQADRRIGWTGLLDAGVVYAVDPLGVIGAVESETGRVRWVRTVPVPTTFSPNGADASMPWQWGEPLPDGNAIVTLTPDRMQVLRLDRSTGAILSRRSAHELGDPLYLLRAGDHLVCVGADSATIVAMGSIADGTVRRIAMAPKGEVRGRVMATSESLLAPRGDGLAIFSLADVDAPPRVLPLERGGNVIALQDQLIALDAVNLHSYLSWEIADRLLTKRINDEPGNPEPAVTAAQLAYHAGHPDRITAAADVALKAIEHDPERFAGERERLFGVLSEMVEASQARWSGDAAKRDAAHDGLAALDLPWMGEVITRLGRSARTPSERVTHLLALGRFQDASGKGALAAEAYQRVLEEPALAATSVHAGMVTIRADLEATRRVRLLVQEQGAAAYGAFAAEAAQKLAALSPGSLEDLQTLARSFPAAPAACAAWLRIAEMHEGAKRSQETLSALREAMDVAEVVRDDNDPQGAPLGEIVGRLATALRNQDRTFSAAQLLSRVREQMPGLALTDHGRAIDDAAMLADLRSRLGKLQRLPRVGSQVRGEPQPVPEWAIMPAQSRANVGRACEQVMMISPRNTRVALWGGSSGGGGAMEPLWSRSTSKGTPLLLRYDAEAVDLIWDRLPEHAPNELVGQGPDGPTIERIGALDGKTRWMSPPLSRLLPSLANEQDPRREGLVIGIGDEGVVVFDRAGRGACLDAQSGRVVWARQLPNFIVSDIVVGGGVVGVGGGEGDSMRGRRSRGQVLVIDSRTGEVRHKFEQAGSVVRWLRLAGTEANVAGDPGAARGTALALVAGFGNAIMSVDPISGRTNWTIGGPGAPAVSNSSEAWAMGERLFLLDSGRSLWMVPLATGQVPLRPLELGDRLAGASQLDATALPNGRTAFTSERGMCIVDASGKIVGSDAITSGQEPAVMIPPMATQHGFVAMETMGHEGENGYRLHLLDGKSCGLRSTRLLGGLELAPRRAAVIDGRIIVTAGPNSVVYPAPEDEH